MAEIPVMLNAPPQLLAAIGEVVDKLNPGVEDIGLVLVVAKTGSPPVIVSSIAPEQTADLFEWLVEHKGKTHVEAHDMQTGESGTLN